MSYQTETDPKSEQINIQSNIFSLSILSALMSLLDTHSYGLQNEAKLWSLALRVVAVFQVHEIIRNNIIQRLVDSFFKAPSELQAMVVGKIVTVTKTLLQTQNSEKEMSALVRF